MYYLVAVNNGVLDIDYTDLIEGIVVSSNEGWVKLREGAILRSTWIEKTQEEFEAMKQPPE